MTKSKQARNVADQKGAQCPNFNNAFFLRNEDRAPKWHLIDAEGKVLGRLATEIVTILKGKNKAIYTPNTDAGDYVVVINAEKVKLTGNKFEEKQYVWYTKWIGGIKTTTPQAIVKKHPTWMIEKAVEGMMANKPLSRQMLKKLKLYAGSEHPHKAQISSQK
jgi:large subunit ribosomal protein L13